MRVCYFCGAEINDGMRIYRSSTCPSCLKDLKICYNCKFYSEGAHWDCLESIHEPVREKDRANFCEYFQFKEFKNSESGNNTGGVDKRKKAKQDFNKLFSD